jgi:DNA invertase Pin-like site-specific DNA recombinase
MRKAAIYLRVSTQDQTTANQERELRAVAERSHPPISACRIRLCTLLLAARIAARR